MQYDRNNSKSIEQYAKLLIGKTWRDFLPSDFSEKIGKWKLGQLLERYYFWYEPNSSAEADFPEAGIELKSTPVIRKSNGSIRSKERLVLNVINYIDIVHETWGRSSFEKKNSLILLVLYLYKHNQLSIDHAICMVEMFKFSENSYDLEIIKNDWETIVNKIKAGKAHELSEGDTMYLGACTKGANAESSLRNQPFSTIQAKQRAFSFKQGYMSSVIERLSRNDVRYKALFDVNQIKEKTFEQSIRDLFSPYLWKSAHEIWESLNYKSQAKNYYHGLSHRILWIESENNIEEFSKANIKLKTIRLKPNGIPKEDISFPAFKFKEIINQEWEDSDLYELLEQNKFFFVIYKMNTRNEADFMKMSVEEQNKHLILDKVILWNAPGADIKNKAQKTWVDTCEVIRNGVELKEKNWKTENNLPSKSKTDMIHVRPHGRNKEDVDELPDGRMLTKQCFWFNNDYIAKQLGTLN